MKIKVCGMKYPENIAEIAKLKIDYLGFIFYEKSPRFVETNFELPNLPKKVGVFVDAKINFIIEKSKIFQLDVIQLHGDETPEFCHQLSIQLSEKYRPNVQIWKVFPVQNISDLSGLTDYNFYVDKFLLDTKGSKKGGNGKKFNWDILKQQDLEKPIILSGGISENDVNSIQELYASKIIWGIDVNSQFEIEPGLKNPERLENFVQKIKML
ncbi:MAG: phosphoribosylanthranilate isomerase [Psychroflexus sp.]